MVGDTPLRLLDASSTSKAIPVKAIHFGQIIKWPEVSGACTTLQAGPAPVAGYPKTNIAYVENIFLYQENFVIEGRFFIPKNCSYILCYEY